MNRKLRVVYRTLFLLLVFCLYMSFSSNPPNGSTGAPGDGVCNNCHFGGTQTGTLQIQGITDNPIIPNKTYNVSIVVTLITGSSTRAGFQFVALDGNNFGASSTGSFSNGGTNVGFSTSGSRTYAEHIGGENTYVGSTVTYTFDWTAPSSSTDNISFYATANIANGSGTGGDLIVFDSNQNIPLPVELDNLDVNNSESGQVTLTWSTLSEQNSDYFSILRSENGVDYEELGKVSAAGNSALELGYQFTDYKPITNKNSFYKLKMVDLDGRFEYSEIKAIQHIGKEETILNVFPNPARRDFCLFIDYVSDVDRPDAEVKIFNLMGQPFLFDTQMQSGVEKGFNKYVLDINTIPNGTYFLSIMDDNQILKSQAFVVNN